MAKKKAHKEEEGSILEGSPGSVGASKATNKKKEVEAKTVEKVVDTVESVQSSVYTPVVNKPEDHGSGIVFAVILIFAGIIFLLNNFGILPWNVWSSLWRFWPVFLILIGLQIIFGRSKPGRFLLGVFSLLIVGAIALVVIASSNVNVNNWIYDRIGIELKNLSFLGAPEERTETFVVSSDKCGEEKCGVVESRNVGIDVGVGDFNIEDAEGGDILAINSTYYFDEQAPKLTEERRGGVLNVNFETKGGLRLFGISPDSPEYSFVLGQKDITTNFDVALGAGSGTIVCDQLKMQDVGVNLGSGRFVWESNRDAKVEGVYSLNVGAGRGELTFADSVPIGGMDIDVGAGSVILNVPEGTAFKIDYNIGAGTLEVSDEDLQGEGNFTSENYESAELKLDLNVDIGAGKVEVRYS